VDELTVSVRYVAMLRERRGRDAERLPVAAGTTIGELYDRLFPPPNVPVGYARNHAQVSADQVLADGDEVVFLPPVGGG